MPAVSVIIPAYRVTAYIAEAIDSVLSQTFTDYEIIVVNDGCPDTTALERELDPYLNRIVYIKKNNGGLSSARNAGIHASNAPLIALLDGDDTWTPDYLAVQLATLHADPNADVVYPNAVFFGDCDVVGRQLMEFSPSEGPVTFESLVLRKCCVIVSVIARKETVIRVGGFNENLRLVEDFDLWLRIVKAGGKIVYHRKPVFRYRRRSESLSSNDIAMIHATMDVFDNAENTFDLTSSERTALAQARLNYRRALAYYSGRKAMRDGDASAALRHFRELLRFRLTGKHIALVVLLRLAPRSTLRLFRILESVR